MRDQEMLFDIPAQFGDLYRPWQALGQATLESAERLTQCELSILQASTHLAMRQWQAALKLRSPLDFQEYFAGQSQAFQEYRERVSEEMRTLAEENRRWSERAMQTGQDMTRSVASAARSAAEQASRVANAPHELPIKDYDALSVEEIQQRLDRLGVLEMRRLAQYERQHRGRKTLLEAMEQRLSA